ncbi:MAG: preprotein translocase subunit SecG [Planctomycetes bacterium]|jgi:protein translocase SecG subunit|nr:preprotein translocase subunit SecG [Planctomycetota bacterium]
MLLASFSAVLLNILFLIICALLIIVVLLQRGRGGGLGAAFGGAGSSAFGTRTGDVFTWVTIVLTALFLLLAIGVAVAYRPDIGQVATPSFDPPAGTITEPTRVRIICATRGVSIHYTVDGETPTEDSRQYEETPVFVEPGMTIKARAFRAGLYPSAVAEATYAWPQAATPVFDPPGGEFAEPVTVTISTETTGDDIYYTGDGSEPTQQSTPYTEPIEVTPPATLRARTFSTEPNYRPSDVVEAEYSQPAPTGTPAEPTEQPEATADGHADQPADTNE